MKKIPQLTEDAERISLQSDLTYLQKRFELLQKDKDLISKENSSLKQELKNFKEYFYKKITPTTTKTSLQLINAESNGSHVISTRKNIIFRVGKC